MHAIADASRTRPLRGVLTGALALATAAVGTVAVAAPAQAAPLHATATHAAPLRAALYPPFATPCRTTQVQTAIAGSGATLAVFVSTCLGPGHFTVDLRPVVINTTGTSFQLGPYVVQPISQTPATVTKSLSAEVVDFGDGFMPTCHRATVNVAVNRITGAVVSSGVSDPVGIPCIV